MGVSNLYQIRTSYVGVERNLGENFARSKKVSATIFTLHYSGAVIPVLSFERLYD